MDLITAYVVVLFPQYVGKTHGDVLKVIDHKDGRITYHGIDRDPWSNLDDMFRRKELNNNLIILRKEIRGESFDPFSAGICLTLSDAKLVKSAGEGRQSKDEIVKIQRVVEVTEVDAQFWGYDCYIDGYGSLLRLGMFNAPENFSDYIEKINIHGLFYELADLRTYAQAYCTRCIEANLEPIELKQITGANYLRIYGCTQ
jgi:hypothetical protein